MSAQAKAAVRSGGIGRRLAAYTTAVGGGLLAANQAEAVVVGNPAVQPFGINGEVNIDFNSDGHTDFQIDHDRYNLNGTDIDYLQLDKNDVSSAENPFPINGDARFPAPVGVNLNADLEYLEAQPRVEPNGAFYVAALNAGDQIGPGPPDFRVWGFQESDGAFAVPNRYARTNRLLDEDAGQIDLSAGDGRTVLPPGGPSEWVGLNGQVKYIGVRLDLNDSDPNSDALRSYGWIGVRITNEADATGEVVGYAYETEVNTAITAGDLGPMPPNADYDDNGVVDGADLLLWQRAFGQSVAPGTSADGTQDGTVDVQDLNLWKSSFPSATVSVGASGEGVAAPVPEPASMLMSGIGGLLVAGCWLLKRRRRD